MFGSVRGTDLPSRGRRLHSASNSARRSAEADFRPPCAINRSCLANRWDLAATMPVEPMHALALLRPALVGRASTVPRTIIEPIFLIVKTSNVNGSPARVSALARKSKVEMLTLSREPDALICSPSRPGGRRIAAIAPSATMPANSGLLARCANFIHELSCVMHQGTVKSDALAIMHGFTGGRRIC